MHAPPELTRISSEKVKHQGTRSQGVHTGTTGATSAHTTCENVARGTFPAAPQAISVKEREGGLGTDTYSVISSGPPSRQARQEVCQGLTARNPRARRLMPANTGRLRRARPAAPYGMARHQGTSALKFAGTHDPRENHTPGHQATGPPWQCTHRPSVRAHNPRVCYIPGQEVEGRRTPGHRITEHFWQQRRQGAQRTATLR